MTATEPPATTKGALAPGQAKVLTFLIRFWLDNAELPTFQTVADAMGWESKNAVNVHFQALVRKGWLTRQAHNNKRYRVVGLSAETAEALIVSAMKGAT